MYFLKAVRTRHAPFFLPFQFLPKVLEKFDDKMNSNPSMNKKLLRLFFFIIVIILFSTCPISEAPVTAKTATIPGFNCYRNLESIYQAALHLENQHPQWVTVEDIGDSWEKAQFGSGHDLIAMTIEDKNQPESKPSLFLVSGLKAKSFAATEINLRFAEFILTQASLQDEIAFLRDFFAIHFIFLANPDGRERAESQALGDGVADSITWTKNTNPGTCTGENGGVSLEHNFSFQWQEYPTDACHTKHPGLAPASEPETQAIAAYLQAKTQTNPHAALLINLEGWQDALISPYLYSKTHLPEGFEAYQILANKILYGASAVPMPGNAELVELQSGSLVDYAHDTLGITALLYRISSEMGGGDIPTCNVFESRLVNPAMQSLLNALKSLPIPLEYSAGPEVRDIELQKDSERQSFEISGILDTNTLYRNFRPEPYVSAAHFSINLPPWHRDATKIPIVNLNPNEQNPRLMDFSFSIPISEVPPEGLQVYIQGLSIDPQLNNREDLGFVYRLRLNSTDQKVKIYFPLVYWAKP